MKELILSPTAVEFLTQIHQHFNPERKRLLEARIVRQKALDGGTIPSFLPETAAIRADPSWQIAPVPADLERRWVEITGPTDAKMMINAMNSGADVYMADFEDANAPTWKNMLEGQKNLMEAVSKSLSFKSPQAKIYQLNAQTATLTVRPRGLHLEEKHFLVDGEPMAGSFFDFGLAFFHNAHALIEQGSGPYYYLPKLESHLEARLWNDLFVFAQKALGVPRGTIRATVLIETILAAFEMEEILYQLKEHICGLNAGRWDYIFSIIKKFSADKQLLFPDRAQITMDVPFMLAYAELLVHTCHKRGAHAMGGMSAFIPNRKDPALNESALDKVRKDKLRETRQGFDGTWVAHPDLVPVARAIFEAELEQKAHQKKSMPLLPLSPEKALLDFTIPHASISEEGFRHNSAVALLYLTSWLSGTGAAALFNLMEDAATAEISRAQLWQWIHHPSAAFPDGRKMDAKLYAQIADQEMAKILPTLAKEAESKLKTARKILDKLVLSEQFVEFLTVDAYNKL
jgi:malate synthase